MNSIKLLFLPSISTWFIILLLLSTPKPIFSDDSITFKDANAEIASPKDSISDNPDEKNNVVPSDDEFDSTFEKSEFQELVDRLKDTEWSGEYTGAAGICSVELSFEEMINNNYLKFSETAIRDAKRNGGFGTTRHTFGILSYDRINKKIVLHQFHSESFVLKFELDRHEISTHTYYFVSVDMQNSPVGWNAWVTLQFTEDGLDKNLELESPQKPRRLYAGGELFNKNEKPHKEQRLNK